MSAFAYDLKPSIAVPDHSVADVARQTRQADIEARLQEELIAGGAEINFRIDREIGRQLHLQSARCTVHRADETGRPARRE